jgi:hypothetical protein
MGSASHEVYTESDPRTTDGLSRLYVVEEAGGQELPDARITEEDRQLVRQLIAHCERIMPIELLMHLSCGIEAAAQRKRAAERGTS